MLGPAVLLVMAVAIMALRIIAEPSAAAAMKAEAFFEAARHGDVEAIRHAVEQEQMPVDLRETGSGMTALMHAVNGRQPKAVEWLLEHGADINACVTAYGTSLGFAANGRDGTSMLALLLERGADPNVSASDGVTPLMQAAMWGDDDAVAMLLRAGARPGARDRNGNTALLMARSSGYDRIVRLLEQAGASAADGRTR
jgi:ankyrin repeat protein